MSTWWQPGQLLVAGFDGTELPPDLAARIHEGRVGGVILFARNFVGGDRAAAQARELVASIAEAAPDGAPVLVAIDQEGGRVQRLRDPWTEWPAMRRLGELDDLDHTAAVARALAVELREVGIHLDFAPVVDVDTNPDNPVIGDRSFGREAARVGRHARRFVEALQEQGVAACAKHFPGHGDTRSDSHFELPRLPHDLERLREVELPPFAAAIEAGVASIMSAHVLFEAIDRKRPATIAPDVMAILREELGYDGLVFSDDLEMKAVADHVRPDALVDGALRAGVDAMLACRDAQLRDIVLRRLESQPDAVVERGIARMVALKERFVVPAAETAATPHGPPYPAHRQLADAIREP